MYDLNDTIYSTVRDAGGLTINTLEDHKLLVGQSITILNDTNYTGTYTISTVNGRTQFIIDDTQLSSSAAPAGTISFTKINIATEIKRMGPHKICVRTPGISR